MKTIKDEWEFFEANVIPIGAPSIQKSEMKLAFYGGAFIVLNLLMGIAYLKEEEAIKFLEGWRKECEVFTLERLSESKS